MSVYNNSHLFLRVKKAVNAGNTLDFFLFALWDKLQLNIDWIAWWTRVGCYRPWSFCLPSQSPKFKEITLDAYSEEKPAGDRYSNQQPRSRSWVRLMQTDEVIRILIGCSLPSYFSPFHSLAKGLLSLQINMKKESKKSFCCNWLSNFLAWLDTTYFFKSKLYL